MRSADAVYADEFLAAIKSMSFKKMLLYVEACESGSMFPHLPADIGVLAVTAAKADENSYPMYCCSYFHDACMVNSQDIGSCLGDMFSVSWLESADTAGNEQTVAQSIHNAKAKTAPVGGNPGSTVSVFGDSSIQSQLLSRFTGNYTGDAAGSVPGQPAKQASYSYKPVHQVTASERVSKAKIGALASVLESRMGLVQLGGNEILQLHEFSCYRALNALIDQNCAPLLLSSPTADLSSLFPDYHRAFYRISKAACKHGTDRHAARVVRQVCTSTKSQLN